MHRSRFSSLVIDCQTEDLTAAAKFWSQALGKPVKEEDDPKYLLLETRTDEPIILLQKVAHPSRVHLDIESDDVDAEAARLERLGARRLEKIHTWWVMEAPTGHRFCVIRLQRGPLPPTANDWAE